MNRLFYGDNLDVLRRYVSDESIDLVYLDPPFNSSENYNVLFSERDGTQAAAQLRAFGDTWQWDQGAQLAYEEVVERGGRVSLALQAFRTFLGTSDLMAYLAMMAPRLVELKRVLKQTGSIYLHCDATASHYLKLLLDGIFAPQNFRNEIIWKRSHAHSDSRQGSRHFGRVTDTILFYASNRTSTWNVQHLPYEQSYIDRDYRRVDPDGRRYRLSDLSGPGGAAKGNPHYEILGVKGYWRYSKEKMDALLAQGRVIQTRPGAVPQYKRYLDEMPGVPLQNLWTDLPVLNNRSKEVLGYPTQKPEALLERIIKASSNDGALILDPFCGCGTTIAAAHHLNRSWVGIDITYAAISVIRQRFKARFAVDLTDVIGAPITTEDARTLAVSDPYQFQWWALDLVGARPNEQTKGADKGIDGRLYCHEVAGGATKQIIFSVKAGTHIQPAHVSELRGVVERERAIIGVLITMHPPTRAMRIEAATGGFYQSPWGKHPRIQIITVEELLAGASVDYPPARQASVTYKPTSPAPREGPFQPSLYNTEQSNRKTKMAKARLLRDSEQATLPDVLKHGRRR